MKIKHLICSLCLLCCSTTLYPQVPSDAERISLNVVITDGNIPSESCRNLENKLIRVLSANGFADNGYTDRFVLAAKVDVLSKDIVPSTPARISQKLDVTLMVGDVIENKVYSTCTLPLSGIGVNDTKAFISAFSKVNPNSKELQDMLIDARRKIVSFYTNRCPEIIRGAQTLADIQQYDEAIFHLVSVPNVCNDCYELCQKEASNIYTQKIDNEALVLLNKAKMEWTKQPNGTGAQIAATFINQINPKAKAYHEVVALRKEISQKLQADAKKEWDFRMKQYDDSQTFKRSIVEACRAIGVAWGENQPKRIVTTIINGWW